MNKAITMKKTIRDDDGRDLLRIASDTLPDAGHKAIEAFYTKSDRDFQQSCEKLLLPRAKRDSADERFKPFGAVRRLTIACDTPELLSVVCDVSVYDGRRRDVTRHSESWDRTNGEQAVEMQESGKRSHYSNYETLLRRHFSKNAFFFTPEAVGFFYQPNTLGISDKPFVYLLPRGTLRERELFKSTTF